MSVLGIITARGGSKGVPGKNIALVGGKPLLAWTIEAARSSRMLTRTIVSTESEEIAEIARQWGAEVPFLRPQELARDDTPHVPVVLQALDWMQRQAGFSADYLLVLQPTSPFRTAADIDAAIEIARVKNADSVIGMVMPHGHPFWCKRVLSDGRLAPLLPTDGDAHRRQDLPAALMPNGAIYLARIDFFLRQQSFYGEKTFAYLMPPERSLDIDSPWDLQLARLIAGPSP